jgi:hypothetical protein
MGTIKRNYRGDGMVWLQIDDGAEFAVHHRVWNDPESRRSIISAETDGDH